MVDGFGNKKKVRVERERPERVPLSENVARWKAALHKASEQMTNFHAGFSVDTLLDEIGAMNGKLVHVPPPKISEKGSPKEMLASLREKESVIEASIEEIENAPCLPSEAKAKLRAEIDVLAAQGAPEISPLFRGYSVAWPERQAVATGQGAHPYTTVSTERDAFSLMLWLNKEAITKRLEDDIDFEASDNALTAEDRATKLAALRKSLIVNRRSQEAVICHLEDEGAFTVPRRNSDPLILLEVELVGK